MINETFVANKKTTRNIKTVLITVPNVHVLKRISSTPTFKRLSRQQLKVGENIENVNHAQYADMLRLYTLVGVTVEDISEANE